ncbi:hypothetical protein LEMLEM_LOCUS15059, partial [Lemmus lemmus]
PTSHKRELGQNLYPTSSKVGTSSTPPLPAVGAVSSHKMTPPKIRGHLKLRRTAVQPVVTSSVGRQ